MLASPHYGERWGRHWLDQARYADSHGYTIDGARVMWPYRDWVLQAFNADLPFDEFTIQQLAGDLLPQPDKTRLIATAFHRNTMINQEGGVKPDQYRHEALVDRVNTTGAVWLGLTVGCAQCHSHKFDPVSLDDYYRLYAFFNLCEDTNNVGPTVPVIETEVFVSHGPADRPPGTRRPPQAGGQVRRPDQAGGRPRKGSPQVRLAGRRVPRAEDNVRGRVPGSRKTARCWSTPRSVRTTRTS